MPTPSLALVVRDGAGAARGVAGHVLDRSGHRIDPSRSISGSLGAELDAPVADHDIRRVSLSPNPFSGSLLVALTATEPARPQSASVAVTVATYTIW